jgi:hypothetical protein
VAERELAEYERA